MNSGSERKSSGKDEEYSEQNSSNKSFNDGDASADYQTKSKKVEKNSARDKKEKEKTDTRSIILDRILY